MSFCLLVFGVKAKNKGNVRKLESQVHFDFSFLSKGISISESKLMLNNYY